MQVKNIPLYDVRPIQSIKDMLLSSVELYSDKAAFLSKDKATHKYVPISYRKYKDDVDAFGTALISLGLKGERIVIIGENRYEWSVSYMSVVNGTGIVVPLDRELPQNEIENLFKRSNATAVIYSGNLKENILKALPAISTVRYFINMDAAVSSDNVISFSQLLLRGYELLKEGDTGFTDAKIDPEALSILLFTSGTTEL